MHICFLSGRECVGTAASKSMSGTMARVQASIAALALLLWATASGHERGEGTTAGLAVAGETLYRVVDVCGRCTLHACPLTARGARPSLGG